MLTIPAFTGGTHTKPGHQASAGWCVKESKMSERTYKLLVLLLMVITIVVMIWVA